MRHGRLLARWRIGRRRQRYVHVGVADPSAKDRLTAALAAEGIGTMDGTTLAAYPTRVEFVTVRHRDRDRTLQIRDRLGLGEF